MQMSARARRVQRALAMENLEANAASQKYFDYAVTLPVKEAMLLRNSNRLPLREASSSSRCLSSPELVQDVARLLTLN